MGSIAASTDFGEPRGGSSAEGWGRQWGSSSASSRRPRSSAPHSSAPLRSSDVEVRAAASVAGRLDYDPGMSPQDISQLAASAGLPAGVGDHIFQSLGPGHVRRSEVLDTIAVLLRRDPTPSRRLGAPSTRPRPRPRPSSLVGGYGLDAGGMWPSHPKVTLASARDNLRPPAASPLGRPPPYRSSGHMNPTLDSSNFMLAWQGGEPFYDEIFLGEKGNTCFHVARGGVQEEARPHSAAPGRRAIRSSMG